MGPTLRALTPSFASVRRPCVIQSSLVRRSFMAAPYTGVLAAANSSPMFHTEVYGHELAKYRPGNGRAHRKLRRGGARHPDAAAHGETDRGVSSRGQADIRSDQKARAAASAFQHDR